MESAFLKAVELQALPITDVVGLLRALSAPAKKKVEAILSNKSNMEYKIREIVDVLPAMAGMLQCIDKFETTHAKLQASLAATLWAQVAPKAESGKCNADILRVMIFGGDAMDL